MRCRHVAWRWLWRAAAAPLCLVLLATSATAQPASWSFAAPAPPEPRLTLAEPPHAGPHEQEPGFAPFPAATFWSLITWEFSSDPRFDRGVLGEVGLEVGLPWRHTDDAAQFGLIPAASVALALGFRGYSYDGSTFQSWSSSLSLLSGMGIEFPAGTLLFGPMLRWELAFRPLRTAGGTPIIGAAGVTSLSLGGYVRFMIHDDALPFPLPVGLYVVAELESHARREVTVGVDIAGLLLLGALLGS